MREGLRESRRCSGDTYPESCITEYTSVYEDYLRHPVQNRCVDGGQVIEVILVDQACAMEG